MVLIPTLFAACAGAGGRPPGEVGTATGARATATAGTRTYVEADVHFMQGMIAHHRQALEMTSLVPERTGSGDIHLMAERIEVSQKDEIAQMARWLETRGEQVPPGGEHAHAHPPAAMPGMLTPEQMASLADARGAEFDRLFLELMIRHHEGALTMVGQLLGSPGAGQDVDVYRIASEVDSDQRMEIQRMERMLAALP